MESAPSFWDYLQIILTAVVTLATVVYAFLTWILVRETMRLRQAQTEPEITLYLEPSEFHPNMIDIIVRNVGPGTAYNLQWAFDRNAPLIKERGAGLDKMRFFDGIPYFAPSQTFRSFFATGIDLLREPIPSALTMEVSYQSQQGQSSKRSFIIDPQQFYGRAWIGEDQPLLKIANKIEKIESRLGDMFSAFKRIKVDVYDHEDREKQAKEFEQRFHAQQSQQQSQESASSEPQEPS